MTTSPPGLTGATIDRDDRRRHDPEALAAARRDPRARVMALSGLDPAIGIDGRLVWNSLSDTHPAAELLFLGTEDDRPHFAELVTGAPAPPPRSPAVWQALAVLPGADAALYSAARSLLEWHRRHGFCANCGTPTAIARGGWMRRCGACAAEHFPRVDPVVIMLAEHGGRVLLGRQAGFPPGRFSALAGYVEVGESLEEAVSRELYEEAGVRTTTVRYVASQPWPFPASLMVACMAEVASDALTLDERELEAAMWVTRDEARAALASDPAAAFLPPPPLAIAHTLLERWLGT